MVIGPNKITQIASFNALSCKYHNPSLFFLLICELNVLYICTSAQPDKLNRKNLNFSRSRVLLQKRIWSAHCFEILSMLIRIQESKVLLVIVASE